MTEFKLYSLISVKDNEKRTEEQILHALRWHEYLSHRNALGWLKDQQIEHQYQWRWIESFNHGGGLTGKPVTVRHRYVALLILSNDTDAICFRLLFPFIPVFNL